MRPPFSFAPLPAPVGAHEHQGECQEEQHKRDVRDVQKFHRRASNKSVSTSPTPISARLGKSSSTPLRRRLPSSQVPFVLTSVTKNTPVAASRRISRCSRDTSSLV